MRRQQRWTVQKRSHEAAQGKVHKEHRRLRNGVDLGGRRIIKKNIGVKTGSFPLKGARPLGRAPFVHPVGADRAAVQGHLERAAIGRYTSLAAATAVQADEPSPSCV